MSSKSFVAGLAPEKVENHWFRSRCSSRVCMLLLRYMLSSVNTQTQIDPRISQSKLFLFKNWLFLHIMLKPYHIGTSEMTKKVITSQRQTFMASEKVKVRKIGVKNRSKFIDFFAHKFGIWELILNFYRIETKSFSLVSLEFLFDHEEKERKKNLDMLHLLENWYSSGRSGIYFDWHKLTDKRTPLALNNVYSFYF